MSDDGVLASHEIIQHFFVTVDGGVKVIFCGDVSGDSVKCFVDVYYHKFCAG